MYTHKFMLAYAPFLGLVHTGTYSFRSIIVPFSGTERLHTHFVLCLHGNTVVPLTCFPAQMKPERNGPIAYRSTVRITFLVVPFIGTERFYLKRSHLNAALQRFTFRNNTERIGTITFPSKRGLTCCYIPLEFISPVCLFLTAKENSMKTDAVKGDRYPLLLPF